MALADITSAWARLAYRSYPEPLKKLVGELPPEEGARSGEVAEQLDVRLPDAIRGGRAVLKRSREHEFVSTRRTM